MNSQQPSIAITLSFPRIFRDFPHVCNKIKNYNLAKFLTNTDDEYLAKRFAVGAFAGFIGGSILFSYAKRFEIPDMVERFLLSICTGLASGILSGFIFFVPYLPLVIAPTVLAAWHSQRLQ